MAMNRILKKQDTNKLHPGTLISGKFKGNTYTIKRKLGEGAIGAVYLCERNQKYYALKISEKQTSITLEVNVLKALEQVQGRSLGPALFDVDDWIVPQGGKYSFYVMEFVKGKSVAAFIQQHGTAWIAPLMMQLIERLEALHEAGWIFGDLKADNLIVSTSPPHIRWIDVGGITQIGRAIKEYTEFYDRGFWGMGTRKAEPSYDLFALAMVFLQIYYPKQFTRPEHDKGKYLLKKVDQIKELKPFAGILKKAIVGKYRTASEMKQELNQLLLQSPKRQDRKVVKRKDHTWLETAWISLLSLFYLLFSFFIH